MSCVIEGCALFLDGEPGVGAWGSLWQVGGSFVFVARTKVADPTVAMWEDADLFDGAPGVTVEASFNHRGVYVFAADTASFNAEARRQLAKRGEGNLL